MTKKLVALLMTLVMLLSVSALAESDDGTLVLEEAQLSFTLPEDLIAQEVSDEQFEGGVLFVATREDQSFTMMVYYPGIEDATLDEVKAELETQEGYNLSATTLNGMDVLAFNTVQDEQKVYGVLVMGADNCVYQFMFTMADEADVTVADQIMATLTAVTE